EGDSDVLALEELMDACEAALTSEATLLDPAEGCGGIGDHSTVDGDHPCFQLLSHAHRATGVAGMHLRDQPVLARVREPYGLIVRVDDDDRRHRSEDLGPEDRIVRKDPQDCSGVEGPITARYRAPGEELRAVGDRLRHKVGDLIPLRL